MVIAHAPRGMNDLFEPELFLWRHIQDEMSKVFSFYGYQEIRTPIMEDLSLFKRGIGEETDIVAKEMFVIKDHDSEYCLRPENTAAVVRALIEKGGIGPDFSEKYYYFGPMFRKERPQKGRLRQFHQFGIECFGVSEAIADVEVLVMVSNFFSKIGLTNITLKLNSLGQKDERAQFKDKLKDYLRNYQSDLCEDCKRRLEINTLRVLDCKKESCKNIVKNAPHTIDSLHQESRAHFEEVLEGLAKEGISFEIDHHLVRGLDYYERTVFEFVADFGLGAQNAVAAGGRYDGLFSTLGNKTDLAAIGCAGGIERMLLLLDQTKVCQSNAPSIALIGADDVGLAFIPSLAFKLRNMDVSADFSLLKKSVKAQMRRADKMYAKYVAVIGEKEVGEASVLIKGLRSDFLQSVPLDANAIALMLSEIKA